MDQWYSTDAHRNWIIPIDVPQPDAQKVQVTDDFKLPMEYVRTTLIPVLERASCIQK